MRLTADYRHNFTALYGLEGFCRVRVFAAGDEAEAQRAAGAVVILSQDEESPPSVRYNVEVIAAEVLLRFALPPSTTAFIEHHPRGWCKWRMDVRPETFELVAFAGHEPEHREVSPGRVLAALSGPEHHPLPLDVLAELVVADLLHAVEDRPGHDHPDACL